MDSFNEPPSSRSRQELSLSLEDVSKQIEALKGEYAAKGIELSGRIIHVTHYLPLTVHLLPSKNGVLSPPLTPPVKASDVTLSPTEEDKPLPKIVEPAAGSEGDGPRWTIGPRWGHSAMFSGIESLSNTHEQIIVGWTGDIERGFAASASSPGEKVKIPLSSVSDEDRETLTAAIESHKSEDGPSKYVPVWLDDLVAHGHYDGYCKTSE